MAAKKNLSLSENSSEDTRIKKIKPYPFEAHIIKSEGTPPIRCHILKITETGFLMRVIGQFHFKVGDNHDVSFMLPLNRKLIKEPIKVIKTYDTYEAYESQADNAKAFTIEMHFRSLNRNNRENILKFLSVIGQK